MPAFQWEKVGLPRVVNLVLAKVGGPSKIFSDPWGRRKKNAKAPTSLGANQLHGLIRFPERFARAGSNPERKKYTPPEGATPKKPLACRQTGNAPTFTCSGNLK